MCNFKIGQKVVCIEGFSKEALNISKAESPIIGQVYTVTDIINAKSILGRMTIGLSLKELNPGTAKGYEAKNFKPIIYKNISKEILEKNPLVEEKSDQPIKEYETEAIPG